MIRLQQFRCGCQCPELWRAQNWHNFSLINFSVEFGAYKGRYVEINAALLGFYLCFEIVGALTRARFVADMDQRIAEAKDGME